MNTLALVTAATLFGLAASRAEATRAAWQAAVQEAPSGENSPHSDIQLVAEVASIRPGEPFTVALHMAMDPEWHSYWVNGGDAGLPLEVAWALPEGFTAEPLSWPVPELIPVAPLMSYGYEDELLVLAEITPPTRIEGSSVRLAGRADWLICADVCYPAYDDVELVLPVTAESPVPDAGWASAIAAARAQLPRPTDDWRVRAWATETDYVLEVEPTADASLSAPYFFADEAGVVEHAEPQRVTRADGVIRLRMSRSQYGVDDIARIGGVLAADPTADETRGWRVEATLSSPPDEASVVFAGAAVQETGGIAAAVAANRAPQRTLDGPAAAGSGLGIGLVLVMAFAGGLLLNLMPCVFPVLSVKVLGLVANAEHEPGRARRHALVFGAGVLLSVWLLAGALIALRTGGESLGWGFHLQSPAIVSLLALLLFGLALSMSGLFDMGLGLTRLGALGAGRGHADSFVTGGLAVVVAAPCTAPFMGVALGYALVQEPITSLAVFTSLGMGLAAPYMLLSTAPGLLRRLPRPGAWMETFKQALAFPVYATVIWLVWVLGRQVGTDAVAVLLLSLTVLAFGLWLWGRTRPGAVRATGVIAVAVTLAAVAIAAYGPSTVAAEPAAALADDDVAANGWEPFTAARVAELRAQGRPVFVDFTAAWCLSCQVNDRIALSSASARQAFAEANVALLKADWTSRDPAITEALEAFGRSSVPLYLVYPADASAEPEILPSILSPGTVTNAIKRASAPSSAAL